MTSTPHLAILGSGPIGIEAALAAADAGLPFTIYESGSQPAAAMRSWGHVRLFTPWSLGVSPRMARHLRAAGLPVPEGDDCPTGQELVEQVLEPLAQSTAIGSNLRLDCKVRAVGREGLLKHEAIGNAERASKPFRLLLQHADGSESEAHADRVLDCTGTWNEPNNLGDGGIPALGEAALATHLHRHVPDFAAEPQTWGGRHTLLIGAGHSAQTAICDLSRFAEQHPGTQVLWALRGQPCLQPIADDALPSRASLVCRAAELAEGASPAVEVIPGVVVHSIERAGEGFRVQLRGSEGDREVEVHNILGLTGYVGDHTLYRQLQVHECYATSGPMKLAAALLGSSSADCMAQSCHGADTLRNPEPGFFILGSKSYGRNTTFLMRTGWEQVGGVMGLLTREPAVA